jgi:hypothetical protein
MQVTGQNQTRDRGLATEPLGEASIIPVKGRGTKVQSVENRFFWGWFLGAFTKLQKATVSFVMSVCPSVSPRGTTQIPLKGFS